MKKSSFKRSLALFMAILMLVTSVPIMAFATVESGSKPADSTTLRQPFISGQPSDIYRIPAMVSLNDGTIVAAVDARWNGGMDGGGNDTMIARSTDGGRTWENQFLNYYPDNGNEWNGASTSVCDSELVTDGENVYLLTVFFPAGYALNNSSANNQLRSGDTAFFTSGSAQGKLKLKLSGDSNYNYYLGDFDAEGPNGRAAVLKVSDNSPTGYFVDHDYYLYKGANKQDGNLFYSDALYQTAKVNFLLLRKSVDRGKTWSDFIPVNAKNSSEAFFGVGPGRGIYDAEHNRIIFSTYTWTTNSSQRSSFIYYDLKNADGSDRPLSSNGWGRIANFPDLSGTQKWTSENALVQIDSKTIRCFVRNAWMHIIYADAHLQDDGSYVWDSSFKDIKFNINGTPKFTLGIQTNTNSGCQLSAIKYSKQLRYNGKYYDAVLLSTPQGVRSNGVIYTLLFDENGNCVNANSSNSNNDKQIQYTVNTGAYGYSCLTELPNGSVKLLYEGDSGSVVYVDTLPEVEKITGLRSHDTTNAYDYALVKGDVKEFLVDDNTAQPTYPDVIGVEYQPRKGVKATMGDSAAFNGEEIWLREALYDFTKNEDGTWFIGNQGVYMTVVKPKLPSSTKKESVRIIQDGDHFIFVDGNGEALCYWRDGDSINQFDQSTAYGTANGGQGDQHRDMSLFEIWRPAHANEANDNSELPGYVRVTDINNIQDGGQYIIGCVVNNVHYFIYPSTSTNNTYSHSVKVDTTARDAGYYMIVTALRKGNSTIVNGLSTYNFDVSDYSNEILGVVEYDPVIYTHGEDSAAPDMAHTRIGDIISDAKYGGEKETCYRFRTVDGVDLSKQYKITKVEAMSDEGVDSEVIQNADIKLTNDNGEVDGRLHGTLPMANTSSYKSYEAGTYVLLKTTLAEIDESGNETGLVYTQTDKLYVASNPVAGHIIYGFNCDRGGSYYADFNARFASFVLADGSYGNTIDINKANIGSTYAGYNAKHLYKFDNSTANSGMQYSSGNGDIGQINIGDTTSYKGAGVVENWNESKEDSRDVTARLTNDHINAGYNNAYYYYDKSSPKNEGITVDPTDANKFSISMLRTPVYHGTNVGVWDGQMYIFDSSVTKLSGDGTIDTLSNVFGTHGQKYTPDMSSSLNKATVNCTTTVTPNTTTTLRGKLYYKEGVVQDTSKKYLGITSKAHYEYSVPLNLAFEIKMCDKSNERNAYNETIKHVLKSTDYTTSSWKRYMDSVLVYQEYLNNYTLLTTSAKRNENETYEEALKKVDSGASTVDQKYDLIQKAAQFSILEKELADNKDIYETGIITDDGMNYTPSSYISFEEAYVNGQTFYDEAGKNEEILDPSIYSPDEIRAETPGWDVGPFNETKLQVQYDIEDNAKSIRDNQPQIAADDSAYVAVKDLYSRVDKTAYNDDGKSIDEIFTNYDDPAGYTEGKIYREYNGRNYVDVPNTVTIEENPIDHAVASALTEMTVATEKANVKQYKVTINANGTAQTVEGVTGLHNYGEIVYIDFSPYFDAETQNIECVVTSYRANEKGEIVPTTTTANLSYYADKNYIVPILIQNDIEFTVTATDKAVKQATIVDYYGTVIGTLTGETVTVDTATQTVTDGNQTIKAKNSPKYSFTGWSLADDTYPITEGMVISQVGKLIPGGCQITAQGGKVNTLDVFNSNQLNLKLTLATNNPNAIWTRTVDGKETLASYEANFVNFSSGADVLYKAYDNIDALPTELRTLAESNTPAINGVGYYANGKFTLSVDYSAPVVRVKDDKGNDKDELVVNVLDAGIIFTTTNPENLYKGGEGTTTYAAPRIAHWSSDSVNAKNSGTFTMSTSKNIDGAYMRAYVSYTLPYGKGTTLPYVAYSDTVYKCEKQADGSYKVTAVN